MASEDITVADIVIYNEISTVLYLYDQNINSREISNVFGWFHKIGNIAEVAEAD